MIKSILKKIILFVLILEAKFVLRKYKPKIIGVTGTVGKTSAKDAIASVLALKYNVRKSEKSYNSEFGVPLTIIQEQSARGNIFGWVKIILNGLSFLIKNKKYPEYLVLEMGIDRPKDMRKLMSWINLEIAVVTAVGAIPVHVEYFESSLAIAEEKAKIVEKLPKNGLAVLNADDQEVLSMRRKTYAKVVTYGFKGEITGAKGADVEASSYSIFEEDGKPVGTFCKVEHEGNIVPMRINGIFGKQAILSVLPAIAIGLEEGINLIKIVEKLSDFRQPPSRLSLIEGKGNTLIIDSTYNSSPIALQSSLEILQEMSAKRKVAVLGDMLELGKYTAEEHRKIGVFAKSKADILITVGPRAKLIAEEGKRVKFGVKNIFTFQTKQEAIEALPKIIEEGDLVLIKGSQGMRMEKIVESLMVKPEDAKKLLCRQEKEWKS